MLIIIIIIILRIITKRYYYVKIDVNTIINPIRLDVIMPIINQQKEPTTTSTSNKKTAKDVSTYGENMTSLFLKN